MWLIAGGAVLAVVAAAWVFSDRSVSTAKDELLAQHRTAMSTIGNEWIPLRDKIEALTLDAARDFKGDAIEPDAARWDFRSVPGIYLRVRASDAKDVKTLREKAKDSVRDSFTGCLLREANPDRTKDVPDAGFGPDQPWNLRQAYASTRVLTDDWTKEVKESDDAMRLRVFEQQYEKAKTTEIPLAIEIVKRAQFYLLVVDEDVAEAKEFSVDGGAIDEEALQQVAHPARVHVWNLKTGAEIVRLRRVAEGAFVMATGTRLEPEVRAAMLRQVNNCALAQDVWGAIRPAPAKTSADSGVDSGPK